MAEPRINRKLAAVFAADERLQKINLAARFGEASEMLCRLLTRSGHWANCHKFGFSGVLSYVTKIRCQLF